MLKNSTFVVLLLVDTIVFSVLGLFLRLPSQQLQATPDEETTP